MEVPMLGQSAAQARNAQPQEPEAPEIIDAETGFLVYRDLNGEVLVGDLDKPVTPSREATWTDIIAMSTSAEEPWPDLGEEDDTSDLEVNTAFIVYRLEDGTILADTNVDVPVTVKKAPHAHDIEGMLEVVKRDADTLSHAPYIAQQVVQTQMAIGRAAQQQMEQARIQQQLAGGKN